MPRIKRNRINEFRASPELQQWLHSPATRQPQLPPAPDSAPAPDLPWDLHAPQEPQRPMPNGLGLLRSRRQDLIDDRVIAPAPAFGGLAAPHAPTPAGDQPCPVARP